MTVHFSSRVDISAPNPIAAAQASAATAGITLGKLNDSNPTRHGLAPQEIPNVYEANPRDHGRAGGSWRLHRNRFSVTTPTRHGGDHRAGVRRGAPPRG